MGFCFIHAADLHLDTPFDGIGAASEELSRKLRDASLDALDRLADVAIERKAAFVLLAGDIYDGPERGLRAAFRFRDVARRLAAAGIDVFAVHGNHDPLKGWSAIRDWPSNVHFFPSGEVSAREVKRNGEVIATVHGISYAERETTENLALKFQRGSAPGLHIGLLHANAIASGDHAAYSPCSADDLARAGMDYWALGHIHARREFNAGRAKAVYPGNTQGRSFKPSEQGAKGVSVVTVNSAGSIDAAFAATDSVRFAELTADIAPFGDLGELLDLLDDVATRIASGADGREMIMRVTFSGRGALHRELGQAGRCRQFLEELRSRGANVRPAVFWSALFDESRPELDREAVRGRGDFAAEIVAAVDGAELDTLAAECWRAPKLAAVETLIGTPGDAERRAILAQAELRLLDGLIGESGDAQ